MGDTKKTFSLSLVVAGVLWFIAGVLAYLFSDFAWVWQVAAGLAGAATIIHLGLGWAKYQESFRRKTTLLGAKTLFNATLVLVIVVMINLIVGKYDLKADLTKNKIHTLSDQSQKVVKGLENEVVLKAFLNPTQVPDFENVFSKYTYYSKKLKREFIDVDKDPLVVQKYNIRSAGTVVVESGDRNVRVENITGPDDPKLEEKITNAIIAVIKGGKKKLYYVSGHGERLLSETGREGFSNMKEALENSRYAVEELSLIEKGSIPEDAEILMMAGPKSEILPQEYAAIEKFIQQGGKVFLMVEPTSPASLQGFLSKYGLDWKPKKVILETNSLQQLAGGNPLTPIVTTYDRAHEITREAKQLSLFPIATPIEKSKTIPEGETVTVLLSSSARSLETDLQGDKVKVNQATDRKGPLALAVAVSASVKAPKAPEKKEEDLEGKKEPADSKTKEYRLVVVGDADFASNSARQFGINADLFQNMMSWLAQEEDLIAIRPKDPTETKFEITETRSRIINLASIVIAPLLMFGSGIVVWARRRRR